MRGAREGKRVHPPHEVRARLRALRASYAGERGSHSKRRGEPSPGVVAWRDPESQPVGGSGEGAAQNSGRDEALKDGLGIDLRGEAEEARSAQDAPAGLVQKRVEPRFVLAESGTRCFQPI